MVLVIPAYDKAGNKVLDIYLDAKMRVGLGWFERIIIDIQSPELSITLPEGKVYPDVPYGISGRLALVNPRLVPGEAKLKMKVSGTAYDKEGNVLDFREMTVFDKTAHVLTYYTKNIYYTKMFTSFFVHPKTYPSLIVFSVSFEGEVTSMTGQYSPKRFIARQDIKMHINWTSEWHEQPALGPLIVEVNPTTTKPNEPVEITIYASNKVPIAYYSYKIIKDGSILYSSPMVGGYKFKTQFQDVGNWTIEITGYDMNKRILGTGSATIPVSTEVEKAVISSWTMKADKTTVKQGDTLTVQVTINWIGKSMKFKLGIDAFGNSYETNPIEATTSPTTINVPITVPTNIKEGKYDVKATLYYSI